MTNLVHDDNGRARLEFEVPEGEIVMREGKVQAEPGSGQFLARGPYDMIRPTGRVPNDFDASAFMV